jgi:hypothetical protein
MKNKLKKYTLGLNTAGNIDFVLNILESDLRKAKTEWARLTGHLDDLWDKRKQTYFDWPVVETKEPALQRKTNPNPFQY